MTEIEIMKALECCRTNIMADCKRCNLRLEDGTTRPYCTTILIGNALDLINRKNAEIERVTKERDNITKTYMEVVDAWKITRAETIKEFAERLLKDYAMMIYDGDRVVHDTDIYNLAKEMGVDL